VCARARARACFYRGEKSVKYIFVII